VPVIVEFSDDRHFIRPTHSQLCKPLQHSERFVNSAQEPSRRSRVSRIYYRSEFMNRLIPLSAAMLAFSAAAAFAQSITEIPSPRDRPRENRSEGFPRQGSRDRLPNEREWRLDAATERSAPGARFRIESGETRIDLQCPASEPTKDCAEVLLQVLDRLQNSSPSEDREPRDYDEDRPRT
jgi:hypothetical protein